VNAAAKMATFLLLVVLTFAGSYWIGAAVGPVDETPTTTVNGPPAHTTPGQTDHQMEGG